MQLRELRGYVERRGWVLASEYVDTGCSGTKTMRPQLARLLSDARDRRIDQVIVWRMDRWGRSFPNCLASIEELVSLGVGWSALSEGIETDKGSATGGLLRALMRACREFGREMRREEIRAGMRVAKRGCDTTCGRPKRVFDRGKVAELREAGDSIRAIAKKLGVGVGTVHRLLSVPKG